MLEGLAPERLTEILAVVPDDIATDAVQEVAGSEAARVVSGIPATAREAIGELVGHAPESAAGRMTGQRLSVSGEVTVAEVIEILRAVPPRSAGPRGLRHQVGRKLARRRGPPGPFDRRAE